MELFVVSATRGQASAREISHLDQVERCRPVGGADDGEVPTLVPLSLKTTAQCRANCSASLNMIPNDSNHVASNCSASVSMIPNDSNHVASNRSLSLNMIPNDLNHVARYCSHHNIPGQPTLIRKSHLTCGLDVVQEAGRMIQATSASFDQYPWVECRQTDDNTRDSAGHLLLGAEGA